VYSERDAARLVTETAVDILKARGEPASTERLLGDVLVGLDRAGQLRRLISREGAISPGLPDPAASWDGPAGARTGGFDGAAADTLPNDPIGGARRGAGRGPEVIRSGPESAVESAVASREPAPVGQPDTRAAIGRADAPTPNPVRIVDQVDRLVALVRDELTRDSQRRLVEVEPGRWWLGTVEDRETAASPLSDRVEWAVYSLLSTAGPMTEEALLERIAGVFAGHDLPDEALVRACLESYRSHDSTSDRLTTMDDLRRRTQEHTELLALLANGGHKLGREVWLGAREQARRLDGRLLGDWLDERELRPNFMALGKAPIEDVEAVDCIWYFRRGATYMFEVEWTAMLGEPLLRRHARIPPADNLVRFLVIPPERAELVRFKLDRSPVLRAAIRDGNWHIIKWNHLRAFLASDSLALGGLEPLIGLDPRVERTAEQLPLFDASAAQ
jgi:hypothetical protein